MTVLESLLDGRSNVWLADCLEKETGVTISHRSLSYYRSGQRKLPQALIEPIARVLNEEAVRIRRAHGTAPPAKKAHVESV